MSFDPAKHHRRSFRLKGFDYGQAGAYFVTICAQSRECMFGDIMGDCLKLNDHGRIVEKCWHAILNYFQNVELDEFITMPNHIHGVIVINNVGAGFKPAQIISEKMYTSRAGLKPAPTPKQHGLSEIIRAFKTFSSRRINEIRNISGIPVWQRNYYEHIIRDNDELNRIRAYILGNPLRWMEDEDNPLNIKQDISKPDNGEINLFDDEL